LHFTEIKTGENFRLHVLNNRLAEFGAFKQFGADHQALKIIRGDSLLSAQLTGMSLQ
jgi:hypothetical protein